MRLLHTSDWHLGVAKHGIDRRPDHERVLAQIAEIARDQQIDAILNTGDLFDKALPDLETLRFTWRVLEELADIAPIVVLCGNHDGPKLFELIGTVLKDRLPIHFIDTSTLQRREQSIVRLGTRDGHRLLIGAVPFIRSAHYIRDFIDEGAERATVRYADQVGGVERVVGDWLNADYDHTRDVRVFAAHLLVEGAQTSGSEYAFHVDADFATRAQRIPSADYVAFGHIHKPQVVPGIAHGRYAGSPIPVDFGEQADQKCVYVVHARPGEAPTIDAVRLDVGRRMVDVRGSLESLAARRDELAGTLARVFVQLETPVDRLEARVREALPRSEVCLVVPQFGAAPIGAVAAGVAGGREPTLTEMFEIFIDQREGVGDRERVVRYFTQLLDEVAQGMEGTFPDIDEVVA